MSEYLVEVARRIEAGERFALVTIVKATGSTPRKEGSRMLVDPAGDVVGSVGGAAVERLAILKALEAMASGQISRLELSLNDLEAVETGMICGGRVELLIEPFGTGPALHLFGAGHVAQPTARLAVDLGLSVTIYDERPEWASAGRFPRCRIVTGRYEDLADALMSAPDDLIAIMTHCHADDYRVLTRVARKPCRYLGVIGSPRKSLEIKKRLSDDGFSKDEIARIECPIGLDIGSHTPVEIAIAVAGRLVQVRASGSQPVALE
ncbi:MAG: XdhC family protein [Calditrichaeota bacterium]|nr:XdhC family protein [Calditrichota bacterium]